VPTCAHRFYADSNSGTDLLQDEVMRYMQQRAGGMGIGDYINQMVNEDRYEAEQSSTTTSTPSCDRNTEACGLTP